MNKKTDKSEVEEIECLEAIDSLYAYLDGELNDKETLAKFKQHLSHCKSCYTRSELEGVISERIKASGKDKAPESLHNRLHDLMDKLK
jgi:anti-sigma factor (TIGR02949 family)